MNQKFSERYSKTIVKDDKSYEYIESKQTDSVKPNQFVELIHYVIMTSITVFAVIMLGSVAIAYINTISLPKHCVPYE